MMPLSGHFDFQTGAWTKRAIRKVDDEDRKLAETIAAETLPGRPLEQKELVAWLLAKPSRLEGLRHDHEAGQRADGFELRSHQRKGSTMNRSETLQSIAKQAGGVTALCKRIAKDGSAGDISEHELTGLIVTAAKAAQPDLSDAQAFSRMFTDMSLAGEAMRKAITIAKSGPLPDDEERDDEDAECDEGRDDDDAMDELHAKANELRKRLPHLSPEQCFAKVYEDPANRRLAMRERRRNSPLRRV